MSLQEYIKLKKIKYNELISLNKKALKWFDRNEKTVPKEKLDLYIEKLSKNCKKISFAEKELFQVGVEMTSEERTEGFKNVN